MFLVLQKDDYLSRCLCTKPLVVPRSKDNDFIYTNRSMILVVTHIQTLWALGISWQKVQGLANLYPVELVLTIFYDI